MNEGFPPWVVFHVPHDSVHVPPELRAQFTVSDDDLTQELVQMTDHLTLALFTWGVQKTQVVCAPVSRLVVDVERFEDDADEPMAARGMGAIYAVTSSLKPLRRPLHPAEREALMQDYYRPHHAKLEAAVSAALDHHDRCLVIDCHSFPSVALPYELACKVGDRPDICIGTDEFHTPAEWAEAFAATFRGEGWSVNLNEPFAGALVPSSRYRQDRRVSAVMVEINRRLYIHEQYGTPLPTFTNVARRIRNCCMASVATCDL